MNVTSKILAAGLSMAFVLSSVLPSQAFTPRANANPIQQQDVVKEIVDLSREGTVTQAQPPIALCPWSDAPNMDAA